MRVCKSLSSQQPLVPRAGRAFDVVAFGENSVDILALTANWPEPDSKHVLDGLSVLPGGQIATAAIAAKRLGARTSYLGVVGDDPWAGVVRSAIVASGVDCRLATRTGARTRTAVVLVDRAGRRTILASRDDAIALPPGEVDEQWVASGRILMIDGTDVPAAERAATLARQHDVAVMVDLDRSGEGAESLLSVADVAITSAGFPVAQTGKPTLADAMSDLVRRYDLALLITTLGSEGAIGRAGDREVVVRAPKVGVVDTTGAGDAFRGAFAAGWAAAGNLADPADLMHRAAVAGALNCRAAGAQAALPTPVDLEPWL